MQNFEVENLHQPHLLLNENSNSILHLIVTNPASGVLRLSPRVPARLLVAIDKAYRDSYRSILGYTS
jgi:hypothetical protein